MRRIEGRETATEAAKRVRDFQLKPYQPIPSKRKRKADSLQNTEQPSRQLKTSTIQMNDLPEGLVSHWSSYSTDLSYGSGNAGAACRLGIPTEYRTDDCIVELQPVERQVWNNAFTPASIGEPEHSRQAYLMDRELSQSLPPVEQVI
jgi:hypothetical protein